MICSACLSEGSSKFDVPLMLPAFRAWYNWVKSERWKKFIAGWLAPRIEEAFLYLARLLFVRILHQPAGFIAIRTSG